MTNDLICRVTSGHPPFILFFRLPASSNFFSCPRGTMGIDIRPGSPYYGQAVCPCPGGDLTPGCCGAPPPPPPPPEPAPSPPVATPAPVPADGPEITGSGGSPPPPVAAEPVAAEDVPPDDEEEEEEGVMGWFKREDMLSMPNWSWVALLLVVILGCCSSCCVLIMTR
jgi:hypothetical protein